MFKSQKFIILTILSFLVLLVFYEYQHLSIEFKFTERSQKSQIQVNQPYLPEPAMNTNSKLDFIKTRDFMSFQCKNMIRLGGNPNYIKNTPNELYRIDGSWFLCLDGRLDLEKDNCNILSFGIHEDYSFDEKVNKDFGCRVFSFDPFVETRLFSSIRAANKALEKSIELKVNPKWTFFRVGISGLSSKKEIGSIKLGDLVDLKTSIKLTGLENQVIDVVKMDIEGSEKEVFQDFDISYACKHFKQLVFETHKNLRFNELVQLEECFLLYKRDTRFFEELIYDSKLGYLTEFQALNGFKLDIQKYFNETYLAEFMFLNGELYFANKNFL